MRNCSWIMRRFAFTTAGLLLVTPSLLAATPNCSDNPATMACRLGEVLSWLHFAAAVLALVLVGVVVVAVRIIRSNRKSADVPSRKPRDGSR